MSHYRPYSTYKDSGVEWIGKVPEHWGLGQIGKFALERCDGPFGSGLKSEHYQQSGVRVIRLQNIGWATFRDDNAAFVSHEHWHDVLGGGHDVVPGDMLMAGLGDDNNPLGRACVVPDGLGDAIVKADCYRFRLIESKVDARFAALLLSATAQAECGFLAAGATRDRLNLSLACTRTVVLPPILEQQSIARALDRETARIDALIEHKAEFIDLLKTKRQAVITHAVTKGLNHSAKMRDSGVEWIGEVPEHWEIRRMASLFREVSRPGDQSLPILSISIHDGITDDELAPEDRDRRVSQIEDRTKYKRVAPKDLAYNMMRAWQGAFGAVTVDGLVSPAYVVAEPIDEFRTVFIENLLRTPMAIEEMRRYSRGIADFRMRLYWDYFRDLKVCIPPLDEQDEILRRTTGETERIDRLVGTTQRSIDLLKQRRTALITAAVTGKIDLRSAA